MDKEEGKFNIKEQKAKRDIYMAEKMTVYQPEGKGKEKIDFPLRPSLHNQTPPEENFVGRTKILNAITEWYKDSKVRIGALIGWGGVGKSALVRKWYDSLEANKLKPDGIFWWNFYILPYLEQFLNALLRYVSGGQIEAETIKSTWEKVERIKEYIGKGAYLIILDGLEEMQKGKESGEKFGCMAHKECTDMLKFLADTKGDGLCLITTRYPLTDINSYEGTVYQKKEIERLSIEDARALFEKVGIKGEQKEIDSVIEEYDGHALSLTLLSRYLVEDFGGDITKAKDIPPFYSDEEAGGKAHRILLWYAQQLTGEQSAFMKIFSLFRRAVREEDFEGVFQAEMETEMNRALITMNVFSFKRMVDNLVDRRLITKDKGGTYATHPLIKNYFDSIFEEKDKRLCHKRIYEYIGGYAPERAETLEEMQPLFEQVYHGCRAGLDDEVYRNILQEKIYRQNQRYLVDNLGAWETALSIVKVFFPEGDLSRMPSVSKKSNQRWLLNEAGLTLKNIGRPKEAEETLKAAIKLYIEENQIDFASRSYQNLADLRFRIGEVEAGLDSAKNALAMAEEAKSDDEIGNSKGYLGWMFYLLGKTEKAERNFKEADELFIKATGARLHSGWGIFYADFLTSVNRIDEAFELTQHNLEMCKGNKWIWVISMCFRCNAAVDRIKGNKEQVEDYLEDALGIARKVGMPYLEVEALVERGRLRLDMERYEDAISDAGQVLKICGRTGFRLYEPGAEIVLGRAQLALDSLEQAEANAKSAYEKAVDMKYRWAEGDAGHLLGEIYLAMGEKAKAQKELKKAVACRKEILDPKVKETEALLAAIE